MVSPLHAATVGLYLQLLPPLGRFVDRADAHCREHGLPPEALTDARLAPDMWNFSQQVMWAVLNSAGAIEGVRTGVTRPYTTPPPIDFAPLREMVSNAIGLLKGVVSGELDAAQGDVVIEFGEGRMAFTAQDFLLSFTIPNFTFHVTTAYAILRHNGIALGKPDFLGRIRLKA